MGLAGALAAMTMLSAVSAVPMRATATELFPTALRATVSGANAIAMALGTLAAFFTTSGLSALLGGLPVAASLLGLALPLAAAIFLFLLPETRGVEIEEEDEALHRGLARRGDPPA